MIKIVFKEYNIYLVLLMVLITVLHPQLLARANDVNYISSAEASILVDNGGYAVQKKGRIIAAHNLHKMFIPASIVKIVTSLSALQILSPQYRYATYFFMDENQNLYIKGFGDPFLVSEEVDLIVKKLKDIGCNRINDIYLDDTAFNIPAPVAWKGSSDNPYDALNSALAVNFNTVNILIENTGKVSSAEKQTPALPLMSKLGDDFKPGIYRININQAQKRHTETINRYVGELFRAFQHKENIPGSGVIVAKKVPDKLTPYYIHESSKTLEDIIGPLLLFSNNFIANQLYLTIGARVYGYPATWEKSQKAVADFLMTEFKLSEDEVRIIEGSGLSRENMISPYAMLLVLDFFKQYKSFLPRKEGKFVKSGTLKGVYSFAGYFSENNDFNSFVLMQNQERNTRERLLQALEEIYNGN